MLAVHKNLINVNVLLQSGLGAASRIFEFIDFKNETIGGSQIVKFQVFEV